MLNDAKINDLKQSFRRILSLPITRSTYRALQNAVFTTADNDTQTTNALFESLLSGEPKKDIAKGSKSFEEFINEFTVQIRTARDVFERGEFISLITTDTLTRQNLLVYLTRIRRIDGEEIQFITDPEGCINVMQHYVSRLEELNRNQATRHIIPNYSKKLATLKDSIERLLSPSNTESKA